MSSSEPTRQQLEELIASSGQPSIDELVLATRPSTPVQLEDPCVGELGKIYSCTYYHLKWGETK